MSNTTVNVGMRLLTVRDIPNALALSEMASWNQTEADWTMLIECFPESCLGLECEGKLAATTTLARYGQRLGWIGMVLTNPAFRRRGFARQLLERILIVADELKLETVKLDATDQGLPLYESLGFREEQPVERWFREGAPQIEKSTPMPDSCSMDLHKDLAIFGANREGLLQRLGERETPIVSQDGYLYHRAGRRVAYIGPCIAANQQAAEDLLRKHFQSNQAGSYFWDLLPRNEHAVTLAKSFGFAPQRRLVRMVRGRDLASDDQSIYAIAGFELG